MDWKATQLSKNRIWQFHHPNNYLEHRCQMLDHCSTSEIDFPQKMNNRKWNAREHQQNCIFSGLQDGRSFNSTAMILFRRCQLLGHFRSCPWIHGSSLWWLGSGWFCLSKFVLPVNKPACMHTLGSICQHVRHLNLSTAWMKMTKPECIYK